MTLTRLTFMRAALAALLLACLIAAASPAAAQKEWVVHSFARDGSQGTLPFGKLVADSAGNLYGETNLGGAYNNGTVYEMVRPVPPKTAWTETVLYSFTGGGDGRIPFGGLVFDDVGNLYGATGGGCFSGCGVVFELSPPITAGSPWTESVLHSFSGAGNGDGSTPGGALIRDGSGNLYGVTGSGSAEQNSPCNLGCGTVFQLSPPTTSGGVWKEAILHSFTLNQQNSESPLVLDSQGDLYGSAGGGEFKNGVVYRLLRPATAGGTWSYKVLHTFGPITTGSPEGANPVGSLTLHGKRVLYGTTHAGGLYGEGNLYQLVPPTVAGNAWTENMLYSFGSGASDGAFPLGNVIFDSAGNIYGTTAGPDAGAVFELTPPASDGLPWTETTLHSFKPQDKGGSAPGGGLIFGKNGVLFGVASEGGTGDRGAVFGLLP